jgi:hypothetical protein
MCFEHYSLHPTCESTCMRPRPSTALASVKLMNFRRYVHAIDSPQLTAAGRQLERLSIGTS